MIKDIALVAGITVCVLLARYDVPARAVRAGGRRLVAFADFCGVTTDEAIHARMQAPSEAVTVRGWTTLAEDEARQFADLERQYWDAPAAPEPERHSPGEAS